MTTKTAKALWLRQTEAARIATVAVVVEVLNELGFMVERARDLESTFIAECAVKGVDVDGCIDDSETEGAATATAVSTGKTGAASFRKTVTKVDLEETPTCPECGSPMVLRHGPHGDFLGCSAFRDGCRQTMPVR